MIDKDAFIEELRAMHNDICIVHDDELVRLIGFYEDAHDYYYHVVKRDGTAYYASCVGACISLKDKYPRYDVIEEIFHINHCPRRPEFFVDRDPKTDIERAFFSLPYKDRETRLRAELASGTGIWTCPSCMHINHSSPACSGPYCAYSLDFLDASVDGVPG